MGTRGIHLIHLKHIGHNVVILCAIGDGEGTMEKHLVYGQIVQLVKLLHLQHFALGPALLFHIDLAS